MIEAVEAKKTIVSRFLAAVEAGDLATIEALQAPGCTSWVSGGGELSRQAYIDAVKSMLLTATSRRVEIVGLIGEGDTVAVVACLAPDARYQALVPLANTMQGADKICAEIARQYEIYVDCDCAITHIASDGDTVFTERVDTVRQLSDGRKSVTHVVGIFDLDASHRITFWREYWDGPAVADEMGIPAEALKQIMTSG